jgi:beta-phosphoglucomutase
MKHNMKVKAIIFDLDGVIVDTARYHYLAWKRLAEELGFGFSLEQNERLKGVSRMTSLKILLEIGGLKKTMKEEELLARKKNEWYVDYINKLTPGDILPGAFDLLYQLQQRKILIGMGSASKNARNILLHIGLLSFFNCIVDGFKVSNAKPDPEVFLLAAAELSVEPGQCIVFEDAVAGVEAAHRAGMKCVGVGHPQILSAADWVVPNLVDFDIEFILKIK